ncbi:hypothetical protein GCM10011352_05030 [Marinobacterium zhoushanense]|uniref:Uncharacterized protein n=1 Tax=Marinobacterium zhoushanense TaxID=1679163 RepID=A0ABQ1K3M3_9GAMM|nr:hypothetical protein [Marinobacterium zhoushanense]GGB82213.1 hypothetical protein GCM10011352_05030 [Marinobacterium zhoushanense]
MCRIDAPFGDRTLDEKDEPAERFTQALDEHGADGLFRDLLIKHFSENWKGIFHGEENFEEALACAQQHEAASDKCTAFLSAEPSSKRFRSRLDMYVFQLARGEFGQRDSIVDFAIDVARECFSKSPYRFYKATIASEPAHRFRMAYYWFICTCYGETYCFSKEFFDDEALTSLDASERSEILWEIFELLTQQPEFNQGSSGNGGDLQLNNLIAASSSLTSENRLRGAREFLRGIEFLKAWVKYESEAGRLLGDGITLLDKIDDYWWGLKRRLSANDAAYDATDEAIKAAGKWLHEIQQELNTLSFTHADLTAASEEETERWARGMDSHIFSYTREKWDNTAETAEEDQARENECLVELCSQLTPMQVEAWIQWTINKDFQSMLSSDSLAGSASLVHGEKWWDTPVSGLYREKLEVALGKLDAEGRLKVLSARLPYSSDASYQAYKGWWVGRLRDLINDDDFPKQLIPRWTVATKYQLDNKLRTPYIDQSLGILRGELSREEKPEYYKQLAELLQELDRLQPTKALRHRLMLLRSSSVPLTDESISRVRSLTSYDHPVEWEVPMKELARQRLVDKLHAMPTADRQATERMEAECLTAFSHELAEFCLSRLRLRKGEKAKENKYDANQITERSSIWRQGYLKALTEIGFDLNGSVHKTVNFTKQSDPDEDVRAIASECYRAVRRDTKKKRSVEDLKRGIIAAEWWLLLCQRRELGLDVNYEEALKTRRRLLRHP